MFQHEGLNNFDFEYIDFDNPSDVNKVKAFFNIIDGYGLSDLYGSNFTIRVNPLDLQSVVNKGKYHDDLEKLGQNLEYNNRSWSNNSTANASLVLNDIGKQSNGMTTQKFFNVVRYYNKQLEQAKSKALEGKKDGRKPRKDIFTIVKYKDEL